MTKANQLRSVPDTFRSLPWSLQLISLTIFYETNDSPYFYRNKISPPPSPPRKSLLKIKHHPYGSEILYNILRPIVSAARGVQFILITQQFVVKGLLESCKIMYALETSICDTFECYMCPYANMAIFQTAYFLTVKSLYCVSNHI